MYFILLKCIVMIEEHGQLLIFAQQQQQKKKIAEFPKIKFAKKLIS